MPTQPELVRCREMDAEFRSACAVLDDGACLIAAGYENDPRLREQLVLLRETGRVPSFLREEVVPIETVAALWSDAVARPEWNERGVDEAHVVRLEKLLMDAARAEASDVLFLRDGELCEVYGIVNDRKLRLAPPLPGAAGEQMMNFLFTNKEQGSGQTSYQAAGFQGFSVRRGRLRLPDTVAGLRCERGPHEPDGDHLSARLLPAGGAGSMAGATLEELGFGSEEAEIFAEIRLSLHGGIFVGGTAGDGKSTTLAANLALQQSEFGGQLNLVTLEDPVEYRIKGAVQIAVPTAGSGEERESHFREALMHFCRIHPASGMVSEIRDAYAAHQVLQTIDTGHQVWTTIHVHSANAILFRLVDMGVGIAEVCKPGNIQLLMKQTLLAHLCPECSRPAPAGGQEVPGWLAKRLAGLAGVRYRNPAGCEACSRKDRSKVAGEAWNGYVRQVAIAEMIRPDERYLGYVRDQDPSGAHTYWREKLAGVPLGRKIWSLVGRGTVDPFDAMRKGARTEQIETPLKVVEAVG